MEKSLSRPRVAIPGCNLANPRRGGARIKVRKWSCQLESTHPKTIFLSLSKQQRPRRTVPTREPQKTAAADSFRMGPAQQPQTCKEKVDGNYERPLIRLPIPGQASSPFTCSNVSTRNPANEGTTKYRNSWGTQSQLGAAMIRHMIANLQSRESE